MWVMALIILLAGCNPDCLYVIGRMHVSGDGAPSRSALAAYLPTTYAMTGYDDLPWSLELVRGPFSCTADPARRCAGETWAWQDYIKVAVPDSIESSSLAHELYHYQLYVNVGDDDGGHTGEKWAIIDGG